MDPFVHLEAVAAPLPRPNIDTDQIIPARFLSRPREIDHGQFLFHDARRLPGSPEERPDFPLNRPEWREAKVVVGWAAVAMVAACMDNTTDFGGKITNQIKIKIANEIISQ